MLKIITTFIFVWIIYCETLTFATDMVIKTKDGKYFLLPSNYEEKNVPNVLAVSDVTTTGLETTIEITTSLSDTIKMTGTDTYDEAITTEATGKIREFNEYKFTSANKAKTSSSPEKDSTDGSEVTMGEEEGDPKDSNEGGIISNDYYYD